MEYEKWRNVVETYIGSLEKKELTDEVLIFADYFEAFKKAISIRVGVFYLEQKLFEKGEELIKEGLSLKEDMSYKDVSAYSVIPYELVKHYEKKGKEDSMCEKELLLLESFIPLLEEGSMRIDDDYEWGLAHQKLLNLFKEAFHKRT